MPQELRTETAVEYQTTPPASAVATVSKKAFNPETGIEYQIETSAAKIPTEPKKAFNPETGENDDEIQMPAGQVVKKAILELKWPPEGLMIKDTIEILAEKLGLSEKQKNAVYINKQWKRNVFHYRVVYPQFPKLLDEGKLKQCRERGPYFFVDDPPPVNGLFPDKPLEENYKDLRAEIAKELLQQIDEKSSVFFGKIVHFF